MRLDYHAEVVSDYGGITGDGLGNLLGAPKLEPLELLVREAVQNSWDARRDDASEVEFGLEYLTLTDDARRCLEQSIFHSHPPGLKEIPSIPELSALVVWDRGTRGLAGPTRASEGGLQVRDFVNFVYMIGETKETRDHQNTVTGGTYGYGRSAFFRASGARTILLHSRTVVEGKLESRFIGIAWVEKYNAPDGTRHTGRHWWGKVDEDWVGPVTGDAADSIARRLGMRLPADDETGTTVMVLDPVTSSGDADSEDADGEEEAEHSTASPREQVVSSLIWNCWPRMVAGGLDLVVRWEGVDVPIPEPAEHPRLKPFVRAFDVLRGKRKESPSSRPFDIDLGRPSVHLGKLGMARVPFLQRRVGSDPSSPTSASSPLRHVALMRKTLLVLKYMEPSRIPPRDGEEYAGVFVTDGEVEEVFARSEPPSHDDWVKERITDRIERRYINVGLRRIKEKVKEFVAPSVTLVGSPYRGSLASLADHLGTLLPGLEESAKGRPTPGPGGGGGGGSGSRTPEISIESVARTPHDDGLELEIRYSVIHVPNTPGSQVTFKASVVTAGGGRESEAPAGRSVPVVKGWSVGDGSLNEETEDRQVLQFNVPDASQGGIIKVIQPTDCTLDLHLDANAVEEPG